TDMFTALRAANLEFVSMVNWQAWDLMDLFKNPDDLPTFVAMSLPETSIEEQLQLFELIHPIHRLLDFWCAHPNQVESFVPVAEWTDSDWKEACVHLHPQLKTPKFREDLVACVTEMRTFSLSQHLSLMEEFVNIDSAMALCLIPLLEQPQSITSLVKCWHQVRPVDPISFEPTDEEQAFYIVQKLLIRLESLGYIMLERP
ncbi:MAG: class I SAM-dependent methyltransferase, partial [Rhizonema sp. PD38]|nr:class I SAM-dependent methyltransferase [Rhizonema sp. PD38]